MSNSRVIKVARILEKDAFDRACLYNVSTLRMAAVSPWVVDNPFCRIEDGTCRQNFV
jgi:hypothetical protein